MTPRPITLSGLRIAPLGNVPAISMVVRFEELRTVPSLMSPLGRDNARTACLVICRNAIANQTIHKKRAHGGNGKRDQEDGKQSSVHSGSLAERVPGWLCLLTVMQLQCQTSEGRFQANQGLKSIERGKCERMYTNACSSVAV